MVHFLALALHLLEPDNSSRRDVVHAQASILTFAPSTELLSVRELRVSCLEAVRVSVLVLLLRTTAARFPENVVFFRAIRCLWARVGDLLFRRVRILGFSMVVLLG